MCSAPPGATRNGVSAPEKRLTRNVRRIVPAGVQAIAPGLPETDTRRALLVHEQGRPRYTLIRTKRRRNAEEGDGIGTAIGTGANCLTVSQGAARPQRLRRPLTRRAS